MSDAPWLTIIGLGEDGPDGLCNASRQALSQASCIMGAKRHLSLLPYQTAEHMVWPVPFAEGVKALIERRGQPTVVLASGDPFWFGAGTTLTKDLPAEEWRAFPGRSTFSIIASRLGWPLEQTLCLGLHAAPLTRLRPHLAPTRRIIATVRDGDAVTALGQFLKDCDFGPSRCVVFEALGGPRERITEAPADTLAAHRFSHPVSIALEVAGHGAVLPLTAGRADDWYDHDGQITKRSIRALTLATLAPRPFEHLWDIGGGSGAIAIEWLLSDATLTASCIEPLAARAQRIKTNATKFGVDRLNLVEGNAPNALSGLPTPDVVFIGGGCSAGLLSHLETLPKGTRLVANAVTLETEALLTQAQARLGGTLMRIDISEAVPIGPKRGWRTAYPITQWSHML